MSDRLQDFLKKNEVALSAPKDELRQIHLKIAKRKSFSRIFPMTAVAAALALLILIPRFNERGLSDVEGIEMIENNFAELANDSDEIAGQEYLALIE
jgi:hypothetical protein